MVEGVGEAAADPGAAGVPVVGMSLECLPRHDLGGVSAVGPAKGLAVRDRERGAGGGGWPGCVSTEFRWCRLGCNVQVRWACRLRVFWAVRFGRGSSAGGEWRALRDVRSAVGGSGTPSSPPSSGLRGVFRRSRTRAAPLDGLFGRGGGCPIELTAAACVGRRRIIEGVGAV